MMFKKKTKNKASAVKKTWRHWCLITLAKLAFSGLCVLGFAIVYLDAKYKKPLKVNVGKYLYKFLVQLKNILLAAS